ncbi:DEAD/DEAH box helicase [Kiloniella sp. b19]|uniref:DEAD/DEAH box helicase n=1 Tax=Kiloniella sp. GXU_MW_B19 TaxID=3141326 RepID=UPI0031D90819
MTALENHAERLPEVIAEALRDKGYNSLTPVQEEVIAVEDHERDLLVSAQTGSGKTVAFGLAMAASLLGDAKRLKPVWRPLALIVAPTRELALQVNEELKWLYGKAGGTTATCVGGMDPRRERRVLEQGAHIVVGTPGRLRDHIERKALDTSNLRVVVLDEADEMLDMGFRDDLEFILDSTPEERRTLLFSATMPKPILSLTTRFQNNALRISTITEREQHRDIEYHALTVAPSDRENAIINLLRYHESPSTIVFCSTRETVKHFASRLSNRGFSVVALSGELSQSERNHALQAMRDGRARVCIATDVAARGIDLPNLDLVVHADIPNNSETLLHRSGRTGRAGRKGICAIVIPVNKRRSAERLMRFAKINPDWRTPPTIEEITERDRERLLNDAIFTMPASEDHAELIKELMERYSPEALATALLALRMEKLPSPEELAPVRERAPEGERRERKKSDFSDGIWYKLNTGRKHKADPKWLLPIICKAGDVTRNDIGAIHIQDTETFFEVSGQSSAVFWETVQEQGTGEKSLHINFVGDMPDIKPSSRPRGGPRGDRDGKPFNKSRNFGGRGKGGDREGGKFHRKGGKPGGGKGKPGGKSYKRKKD